MQKISLIEPAQKIYWHNLLRGKLYKRNNDLEEAKQHFIESLDISFDPMNNAVPELLQLYYESGDMESYQTLKATFIKYHNFQPVGSPHN